MKTAEASKLGQGRSRNLQRIEGGSIRVIFQELAIVGVASGLVVLFIARHGFMTIAGGIPCSGSFQSTMLGRWQPEGQYQQCDKFAGTIKHLKEKLVM